MMPSHSSPLVSPVTTGGLRPPGSLTWHEGELCSYGVPPGCTLRNTFLEWQESDEFSPGEGRLTGARTRLKSCPGELSRRGSDEDQCDALASGLGPLEGSWNKIAGVRCRGAVPPLAQDLPDVEDCKVSTLSSDSTTIDSVRSPTADDTNANDDCNSPMGRRGYRNSGFRKSQKVRSPPSARANPRTEWNRQRPETLLILRGLPFAVTEAEVMNYIERAGVREYLVPHSLILLSNKQGRPSGFAEVQLLSAADFCQVRKQLHYGRIGGRYIEAMPPRQTKPYSGSSPAFRSGGRQSRHQAV